MEHLFTSGLVLDGAVGLIALEAVFLTASRRLPPLDVLGQLLAGALLLLGVRSALLGAPWWVTAAWVGASLPAHLFDLLRRARPRA